MVPTKMGSSTTSSKLLHTHPNTHTHIKLYSRVKTTGE